MSLSSDKQTRKDTPMARGLLDYFPDACAAVAHVSFVANEQHNPGEPMHWAKEKSTDHADCIVRHLVERGTVDEDGLRHSAKVAWRALALLQVELDEANRTAGLSQLMNEPSVFDDSFQERIDRAQELASRVGYVSDEFGWNRPTKVPPPVPSIDLDIPERYSGVASSGCGDPDCQVPGHAENWSPS